MALMSVRATLFSTEEARIHTRIPCCVTLITTAFYLSLCVLGAGCSQFDRCRESAGLSCNGKCVRILNDPQNCGACGARCGSDEVCSNGRCENSECDRDVDCDDGDPCNGTERCESARCVVTAGSQCDDGNACTLDVCMPDGTCEFGDVGSGCVDDGIFCTVTECNQGRCEHRPDDGRCADGQTCDPETGCDCPSDVVCEPTLARTGCSCPAREECIASDRSRTTQCTSVGTVDVGQPCNLSTRACLPGSVCSASLCRAMCDTDSDCTRFGDSRCVDDDRSNDGLRNQRVCSIPCTNDDDCRPIGDCRLVNPSGAPDSHYRLDCVMGPPGAGEGGAGCEDYRDCAADHVCVGVGGGRCRAICASDGDCGDGARCIPLETPSSTPVGYCLMR